MTAANEKPDSLTANLGPLTPEHVEVFGDELAMIYRAFVADYRWGALVDEALLLELLRSLLLRSGSREVEDRDVYRDQRWVQYEILKLIFRIAWYLGRPQMRVIPPVSGSSAKVR